MASTNRFHVDEAMVSLADFLSHSLSVRTMHLKELIYKSARTDVSPEEAERSWDNYISMVKWIFPSHES